MANSKCRPNQALVPWKLPKSKEKSVRLWLVWLRTQQSLNLRIAKNVSHPYHLQEKSKVWMLEAQDKRKCRSIGVRLRIQQQLLLISEEAYRMAVMTAPPSSSISRSMASQCSLYPNPKRSSHLSWANKSQECRWVQGNLKVSKKAPAPRFTNNRVQWFNQNHKR